MKFVTALLLLCAVSTASAQSLRLVPGQVPIFSIPVADDTWDDHAFHLNIQNTSTKMVPMRLTIDESKKLNGHRQRFCIGMACYAAGVTETDAQGEVKLMPNAIDESFKMEFHPGTVTGVSRLTYTFFNYDSPIDKFDLPVDFYVGVTSVEPEQEQRYMSVAMPTPADNIATIAYTLPDNAQSGTIVVRDILGNTVSTLTLSGSQGLAVLNTANLAAGTYQYSLVVNGAPVSQQRIVVAH